MGSISCLTSALFVMLAGLLPHSERSGPKDIRCASPPASSALDGFSTAIGAATPPEQPLPAGARPIWP